MSIDKWQLVVMLISDRYFAIKSEYFREVIQSDFSTPVPFVPAYIEGLVNIDGKIATQIDLGRLISGSDKASPGDELAFIHTGRSLCALRVQQVVSIIELDGSLVKSFDQGQETVLPRESENQSIRFVSGEFVHEGKSILLLDHSEIGLLVHARAVATGKGGVIGKAAKHELKSSVSTTHYLAVYSGKERYGFAIDAIKELVKATHCTPIPGAPTLVAGLALLRGQPVLTAHLQGLLNQSAVTAAAESGQWIILVEHEDLTIGMMVDEIAGIEECEQAQVVNVSHPDSAIWGVVENAQNQLTMLVDPANLFSSSTTALLKRFAPANRQHQVTDVDEVRACLSVLVRDEFFAIPLDIVSRVLQYRPLESLLDELNHILGAIDVDGRVVPVVNMHTKTEGDAWSEYVIVETGKSEYAIRVNKTHNVINLPVKNISSTKNTGNPFVAAIAQFNGSLYSLFNIHHLNELQTTPCE